MDPNVTLHAIRDELCLYRDDDEDFDSDRLAELFDALDAWMCAGGFLPSAWNLNRQEPVK